MDIRRLVRSGRRPRPARLLTVGVFALAGLLFWASSDLSHGTDLRTDDTLPRLGDLVKERSRRNTTLDRDNATLREKVDTLAAGIDRKTGKKKDLTDTRQSAGTGKLHGSGLTVTLKDAPRDAHALVPDVPEPEANDLVIHQQDIQAVVNALWAGGAKGIRVMDQRLVSTSAVRCVGNTLLLQGRVYSPPYTITAVGDAGQLRDALESDRAVSNYRAYVRAYGLGWKVTTHGSVTLPGFTGSTELHYAKPLK